MHQKFQNNTYQSNDLSVVEVCHVLLSENKTFVSIFSYLQSARLKDRSHITPVWWLKLTVQRRSVANFNVTRGPKGHISCTWVQCATFLRNQPGRPFLFSDRPEKYKLWGHWDLASCQVSLNSVQRFQRSQKCLSQSEARAAILFFRSTRKTQSWQRMLTSCFLSCLIEFRSAVSEEKLKMSQPIRCQGGHILCRSARKTQTW